MFDPEKLLDQLLGAAGNQPGSGADTPARTRLCLPAELRAHLDSQVAD